MSIPLFRREALEHSSSRAHGVVLLTSTPASRYLTLGYVALGAGLLIFLALGRYTRSVAISGVLQPEVGVTRIVSGTAGLVSSWHAAEGQVVAAGQPLLTLRGLRVGRFGDNSDEISSQWLRRQQQSWDVEARQLDLQLVPRQRRARERLQELQAQEQQLQIQLATQVRREQLARAEWQRYRDLLALGYVAAAQLQEREAAWLDQQQRSAELERSAANLAGQLRDASLELRELQAQGQRERANVQRNVAVVQQQLAESEGRGEWQILATNAGVIDALTVQAGQAIVAGQPLALLHPEGAPLVAELYAPTRAVGLLHPGQSVSLRYQAFPYQKYGQQQGTIVSVSGHALQPNELDASFAGIADRGVEPLYRVRVRLTRQTLAAAGGELSLRPGSLVDASVRLDTRRIYEWLLAPLMSWRGRW